MAARGEKHSLPVLLSSAETAQYSRLVPPPGPWMNEVWIFSPAGGAYRRSAVSECRVPDCNRAAHEVRESLCHPHAWQWYRAGRPLPVVDWIPFAKKPRERNTARPSIDFRGVPPLVAQEVRYVVGTKVTDGDWTPQYALRQALIRIIEAAQRTGVESLFDRHPEEWVHLASEHGTNLKAIRPYMKTFFSTLHRTAAADPWDEDRWLWRHGFEVLLNGPRTYRDNVRWDRIKQLWLRSAAKRLAKQRLITGQRSWNTIITWARAISHLSTYLEEEGVDEPSLLDRELFLDYLADARTSGASKNTLLGINTAASVLADLRQEGYLPDLGSEVFLRHGENSVERAADPRPFPPDIVERIDRMLDEDPELDQVVRVMLKLNRWGGLRISELVSLPLDCLRVNHTGGMWVEYYMTKTKAWRRFPLPDDLADLMRAQQRFVRSLFGEDAEFMFPSLNRSSRISEVIRPWSTAGLRNHTYKAFIRNGITESSITGERISGSSIHRFRHTIGTALLNNNWSQPEVQQFLGHDSPTMTGRYARITDDTLNRRSQEFHAQQNIDKPKVRASESCEDPTVERLRAKFTAVLPDGYCQLPAGQHCDFRENPCKKCSFYDPGGEEFAPVHENHRKLLTLFIVEHQEDSAKVAINRANLDALNHRIPGVS